MAALPSAATKEQRMALIKDNLQELLNPEILEKAIDEGRNPKVYFGTATTGKPHCAYFVAATKIAQLMAAGCDMTILLADIHGMLDNLKAPIELVEQRAKYYQFIIRAILEAVGINTENLKFVLGSSYQKSPEYVMDVYKLCSVTSEGEAKKAGAEIVKQSNNAPLSGLLYPILQILDEEHLGVDAQLGGLDQRKLFVAAKEWLPKLGYRERAHIIFPMVPGLQGGKMSSSDLDSKIDLLDPPNIITQKIRRAECFPKVVDGNGIIAFIEYVLLPASELKGKREFVVERERDGLEPLVYTEIAKLKEDYEKDLLTPQLLKPAVSKGLIELTTPIQDAYNASAEWQETAMKAYPPPVAEKKKEKKPKNKGTRHPGADGGPKKDGEKDLVAQAQDLKVEETS